MRKIRNAMGPRRTGRQARRQHEIELPEDQTTASSDPDLQSGTDTDSDGSDRGATDSSTLSYDVVVADPDGSPSIVAWGAPGDGPNLKDYQNRKGRQ